MLYIKWLVQKGNIWEEDEVSEEYLGIEELRTKYFERGRNELHLNK